MGSRTLSGRERPWHGGAPVVAVAGLSARMLAQSAARAGLNVLALDVFGDRDTHRDASLWFDIGDATHTAIDRRALVDALSRAARLPHFIGWIAGSGLEPMVAELAHAPYLPRLIGNGSCALAAVREPRRFFALLDALRIPYPRVSFGKPPDGDSDWLAKRANGCGGTHVVAAALAAEFASGDVYFQRKAAGRPMSALFVAARRRAAIVGFADQSTCALGDLPFVHAGASGPVELPGPVAARIAGAIAAIVGATDLVGVNSLDFMLDGDSFEVLEINARPSSTLALYEAAWPNAFPRGLLGCHIDACVKGVLPAALPFSLPVDAATAGAQSEVRPDSPPRSLYRGAQRCVAQRVVFAPHPFIVSGTFSNACDADPACHDVPWPGTRIDAGQPVCTLSASAATPGALDAAIQAAVARLLHRIETSQESRHELIAAGRPARSTV